MTFMAMSYNTDTGETRPATNWERLTDMTADEFANCFWEILDHSRGYNDSRVWLKQWLNAPSTVEEWFFGRGSKP